METRDQSFLLPSVGALRRRNHSDPRRSDCCGCKAAACTKVQKKNEETKIYGKANGSCAHRRMRFKHGSFGGFLSGRARPRAGKALQPWPMAQNSAFLRVGDCTIELICRPGGNVPSAPGQVDHICFDVCDIEPLVERLRAQGVSFLSESVSHHAGWTCGHQKHFPHRPGWRTHRNFRPVRR